MKLVSLLAGVAAVALTAGAASAQDINVGQNHVVNVVNGINVPYPHIVNVSPNSVNGQPAGGSYTNSLLAKNGAALKPAWHAIGNAADDNGTAAGSDGATFTMTGTVSTDCAYYSGNNNTETLNFGQIGIYASDETGPAAAFTMVAPATLTVDTNLAGCNTANTVRVYKTDIRGMVNNTGSAYDTDVFQANLPYTIAARYTASGTGAPAAGTPQVLNVAADVDQATRQHGAWKSPMALDVVIPVPGKALLAGAYSGTFGVTISAGL